MPQKWTAMENEELLIHILQTHKIDYGLVSDSWKKKDSNGAPSVRAVREHVNKLVGSGGKKTPSKSAATPRTPKPPTTPKDHNSSKRTPASGTKRKALSMSDEDESDEDMTPIAGTRRALPRRSKDVQSIVLKEALRDSDDDDDVMVDSVQGKAAGAEVTEAGGKASYPVAHSDDERTDESDISDYAKTA